MSLAPIKTPCVGICSTGIGDDVCRGCKRYAHEVIDWNSYNYDQKASIERRLVKLLTNILQDKFTIVDEPLLRWQIKVQQVNVAAHRNLYCQAYDLLKAGASQISEPFEFGILLNNNSLNKKVKEVCEEVDQEFYALSVAHYERYFCNFA